MRDATSRHSSTGERERWRTPSEALEADVVQTLTRATVTGTFWVDLETALRFLEREREGRAEGLTLVHLYVKAAALAALSSPLLHRQYGRWRVYDPLHADVGVSVAGRRALAPVVVIDAAETKPLTEIALELRSKSRQALRDQRRVTAQLDRWGRLFPFAPLRRFLIRRVMASPMRRRKIVGTIQISDLSPFDIDAAIVPLVGELLLMSGAVRKAVVAGDDDRPVAKRGATFVLQGSHLKVNGRTAGRFMASFRSLLLEPETLL